uniref:Uncharacterized protein n=1 Tax=Panagrolaimus sp. PS1159 TaxID=55785 RepID=A0AC35EZ10_9BILA
MATKENCFVLKAQPFHNYYTENDNNQYSNINLNQSKKTSTLIPVHSQNKSYNDKHCVSDKYKTYSWVEDYKSANSNTEARTKGANKSWKKSGSTDNTKNSTLSLHIIAYKNSFEVDSLIEGKKDESIKKEKYESIKEKEDYKQICIFLPQNPFEFPRQQNDKVSESEVSKYKASQRLINSDQKELDEISQDGTISPPSYSVRELPDGRFYNYTLNLSWPERPKEGYYSAKEYLKRKEEKKKFQQTKMNTSQNSSTVLPSDLFDENEKKSAKWFLGTVSPLTAAKKVKNGHMAIFCLLDESEYSEVSISQKPVLLYKNHSGVVSFCF